MLIVNNNNKIAKTPTFVVTKKGEELLTSISSIRDYMKDDLYQLVALYNQIKQNVNSGLIKEEIGCITMPGDIDYQQMFNLCLLMDEIRYVNQDGKEE